LMAEEHLLRIIIRNPPLKVHDQLRK